MTEPRYIELENPSFVAEGTPGVCRVCANTNEFFIQLYSNDNHGLVEKINRHLPITVSEVDSLPCHVCYQCASTVLAFSDLVDSCIIAQKRLECMLPYRSGAEEQAFQGKPESHFRDPNFHLTYNDCFEQSEILEAESRNLPKSSELNDPADSYEDLKTNGQPLDLGVNDLEDTNVEPSGSEERKKKRKNSRLSKCPICGKVFMYLSAHLASHSDNRPHKCRICNSAFKRKDHVNYHRKTVHMHHPEVLQELKDKGEQYLTCERCGEVRATKHAMVIHLKKHSTCSQCEICGESFNISSALKEHMIRLHSRICLPCSICGEQIDSGRELYLHKQRHLTSFICDVCGKRFAKQSSLTTHMVVHSEERPFSCEDCGKSFKLKIRLQLHKQSHKNLRPYACSICKDKKFKTKYALAVHNNMHNDVRAYPCSHCPFRARKHHDLVCHIRTHTGEKPHKCEICGRGFAQAGDMRKHRSTHERHKT